MSGSDTDRVHQASAVAIGGRALLIEGPPGAGKSSLALALIDRGAQLIGDDAVTLSVAGHGLSRHLVASPPPNTAGMIEVRGVGIANFPTSDSVPVALILSLGEHGARLPDGPEWREMLDARVPILPFDPGTIAPAERARMALALHGLDPPTS